MNVKKSIMKTLCLLSFFFSSCKKEPIKNSNPNFESGYLVFGHFYGLCGGEKCIEIYRLENNQLFEDTADKYPITGTLYNGNFVLLSQQKYNLSKDLINYFPPELLAETKNTIGQPDEADGGGIYIEIKVNGVKKFYIIDQVKNNVPAIYHGFIEKINEKIELIQ